MPIAMPFVVNGGTVKLSLCESRLLQVKAVELLENEEREWDCDPKRGTFTIDVHETEYPNKMMFPSPFWLVNLDDIFWASLLIPWMQLVHRPQIPICSYRWSTIFFPVFITALVGGGGRTKVLQPSFPSQVSTQSYWTTVHPKNKFTGPHLLSAGKPRPRNSVVDMHKCYLVGSHLGCSAHHWTLKIVDWKDAFLSE